MQFRLTKLLLLAISPSIHFCMLFPMIYSFYACYPLIYAFLFTQHWERDLHRKGWILEDDCVPLHVWVQKYELGGFPFKCKQTPKFSPTSLSWCHPTKCPHFAWAIEPVGSQLLHWILLMEPTQGVRDLWAKCFLGALQNYSGRGALQVVGSSTLSPGTWLSVISISHNAFLHNIRAEQGIKEVARPNTRPQGEEIHRVPGSLPVTRQVGDDWGQPVLQKERRTAG